MILGGAVSLLLLLGGPQAPPEDRPTSGGGSLAEYPIEIGDPWDMGGGGYTYQTCFGPYYNGTKKTWYLTLDKRDHGNYATHKEAWEEAERLRPLCKKCYFR